MAKVTDLLIIAVPVGLGIGYFTDCFGVCTGFKAMIDDFIGSILGPGDGGGNGNGNGNGDGNGTCTKTCTAPQVLNTATCTCETPNAQTATVTVNKTIYAAGDTIAVTGSGFAANEVVGCRFTSNAVLVLAKDVTASASGGFTTSFTAVAVGGHITCTGKTSGKTGQALVNHKPVTAFTSSFYSDNSRIYRGSYGASRPRTSITPVVLAKNRPQMRLNSVAGFGDNDRI